MHNAFRNPAPSTPHGVVISLALVTAALLPGCGNLTAGGLTGEAVVAVSGDVASAQPTAGPAVARAVSAESASEGNEPEGELEAEFLLFLEGADGRSIALSDQEIRVRVDLRGRQEADVVNREVPAMHYTGLRIVFTEIKARVDSGLVINGVVVSGDVEVELKDVTLSVVRPLSLEIGDGDRAELLVDLNAATWLQAVDPDLKRVAEEIFAQALAIVVR